MRPPMVLKILSLLMIKPMTTKDLADHLDVSRRNVESHLRLLTDEKVGLVERVKFDKKRSKWCYKETGWSKLRGSYIFR